MSGIGVLALQGDFVEHIKTFSSLGVSAQEIRKANQISDLDALVIPGGESTTISYLMDLYNFRSAIKDAASSDLPIWGTCAGLIFLSNQIVQNSSNTSQKLLGSLDIETERNAFGRQHESFQSEFPIPKFGLDKFTGVFIRAPRIRNIGSNVEILAKLNDEIVAVKQGNIIGTCFHPELSNTVIFHKYLIELVRETL